MGRVQRSLGQWPWWVSVLGGVACLVFAVDVAGEDLVGPIKATMIVFFLIPAAVLCVQGVGQRRDRQS